MREGVRVNNGPKIRNQGIRCQQSLPNVFASLELGEERRLVAHGFGTAVGGTGTFNFWQSAAKRGSSL
jgi:hypothetical protein